MQHIPSQQPQARHINTLLPCIKIGSPTSRFFIRRFYIEHDGGAWQLDEEQIRPTATFPLPEITTNLVREAVDDPRSVGVELVKDCGNADHPQSRQVNYLPPTSWRQTEAIAAMPIVAYAAKVAVQMRPLGVPTMTSQAVVEATNRQSGEVLGNVHVMGDGKFSGSKTHLVPTEGEVIPLRAAGQYVVAADGILPLVVSQPVDVRRLMLPFTTD